MIHLVVPKTGKLTPAMLEWLFKHGGDASQPELFFPVRRIKPKALARVLLKLDPSLIPELGEDDTVILTYPMQELGIRLVIHKRGLIIQFPYMGGMLARIVLGITYTYIRFLYDQAGFWSFDPQLNVISYADDYQSIDETADLMEQLLPRMLNG
ncbi:MAG TPA: hypothetical protein VHD90_21085 [Phototrophicaceae bacterium]|nr:hypothetical protein [Phototrophicaceae bacterium]